MPLENVTSAMISHLGQSATELATCWSMTLVDGSGESFYFTNDAVSVTVSGITYSPTAAMVPAAADAKIDLSVDNSSLLGVADVSTIAAVDILAGRLDRAEVEVFDVVRTNPDAYGKLMHLSGNVGRIALRGDAFELELRGFADALQQDAGELYLVTCQAELGDSRCNFVVAPSAWASTTVYSSGTRVAPSSAAFNRIFRATTSGASGGTEPAWTSVVGSTTADGSVVWETEDAHTKRYTVTSVVVSSRIFEVDLTDADGRYDLGVVTWVSGLNQYAKGEVKVYSSSTVELYEPAFRPIVVGDTGDIQRGCDKAWETCTSVFSNGNNYRGFPHVLGLSKMLRGK